MTTTQRRSANPITDPYAVEEQLARELQRRKVEEEKKRREIERICANSEEIKRMKMQVQTSLVNKERTQQIAEAQARRINEIREECEIEAALLRKRERELQEEKLLEQSKLHQRIQGREVLKHQMLEKYDATREAQEQYLREKESVNHVVQRLIEDDRKLFETTQVKKKHAFKDMQDALTDKQQKVLKDKQREQEENAKYLEFIRQKEQQAQEIKIKKMEENAAKEQIFLKLKEEEERRRHEQDLLTDLRFELYREQFEAQEREKERLEAEKRERQKFEMQQAEKEARLKKLREHEEEKRIEKEFKDAMMRKFAEDDKIEQMAQSKRRMREVEHKREVEKLWQEKLGQYQAEKEKELQEHRKKLEEERYHQEVINQERDRILREHLADLGEHAPKGLLKTAQQAGFIPPQQQQQQQRSNYSQNFRLS